MTGAGENIESLDQWLESSPFVHAPATMLIAGLSVWFLIKWSIGRNTGRWKKEGGFWHSQKDEILVSLGIGGLLIIYDSQLLAVYDLVLERMTGQELSNPTHMKSYYWFLVGPVIDRIYSWLTPNAPKVIPDGEAD